MGGEVIQEVVPMRKVFIGTNLEGARRGPCVEVKIEPGGERDTIRRSLERERLVKSKGGLGGRTRLDVRGDGTHGRRRWRGGAIDLQGVREKILSVTIDGIDLDNIVTRERGFNRMRRLMEAGSKTYIETVEIPNEVSFFEGQLCPFEHSVAHEFIRDLE